MIRAIQIGTATIQGHVTATWPDPTGEHGAILSMGRVIMGRLIESNRGGRSSGGNQHDAHVNKGREGGRLTEGNWEAGE